MRLQIMDSFRPIWTEVFLDQARDDVADALGFSSWTECHDEIFREAQGSVCDAIAILKHRLDETGRCVNLSMETIDYLWKNPEREAGNEAADSTGVQRQGVRQIILRYTPQQDTREHLSQLYHFRFGISVDEDTQKGDL